MSAEEQRGEHVQAGMAAEHALLGLLALRRDGQGHGYDLARQFDPDAPLGNVIRLEPGMVYHFLKKLERLGWVTASTDGQGRPARRQMSLSEAGREELSRWLAEPVAHTREIRLEFLVKLYFALVLEPALAVRLVHEQRALLAQWVDTLRARVSDRHDRDDGLSRERWFGDMVLDMRLAQTEAALAWLDRVEHHARGVAGTV